jgi:hypothetical protein
MAQRLIIITRAVVEWVRTKLPLAASTTRSTANRQPLHGRRGYGDSDI